MKVSIIGSGYVGLVTGVVFAEKGHDVLCIDADPAKVASLQAGKVPIYEPGLEEMLHRNIEAGRIRFTGDTPAGVEHGQVIFIAVGTPSLPDGKADLSAVETVAREVASSIKEYKVVVEKSTVPVRTGERVQQTIARYVEPGTEFDVVSNPEFLREGAAIEDALDPDRIVVGVASKRAEKVMRELYRGYECPFIVTDIASAEIIKHASNSFLALKISYINAVANVCELAGANVDEVAQGMGLDTRIGPRFLGAGIGYGGSCFAKDVAAFAAISRELGYDFKLLDEVQGINLERREKFVELMEHELWILRDKTVAVLGLAFKPDTDDMRDAPAITVIEKLLEKGAKVRAHDPAARDNARAIFGDRIEIVEDPYDCLEGADCVALLTEWQVYQDLDLARAKSLLAHPTLFDARNVWSPAEMAQKGFTYRSFGR